MASRLSTPWAYLEIDFSGFVFDDDDLGLLLVLEVIEIEEEEVS